MSGPHDLIYRDWRRPPGEGAYSRFIVQPVSKLAPERIANNATLRSDRTLTFATGKLDGFAEALSTGAELSVASLGKTGHRITSTRNDAWGMDVFPLAEWCPDVDPQTAYDALTGISEAMQCHGLGAFGVANELLGVPRWAGQRWMQSLLPTDADMRTPDEALLEIASTIPQRRMELGRPAATDALFYYDAQNAYPRTMAMMNEPAGEPTLYSHKHLRDGMPHDDVVPYRAGFYRIEARVPDSWPHIGLVAMPGDGRVCSYPTKAGTRLKAWVTSGELHLILDAADRDARYGSGVDRPSLAASWGVRITEALLYDMCDRRPFQRFFRTTREARDFATEERPRCKSAIDQAIKMMRNGAIGLLGATRKTEDVCYVPADEMDLTERDPPGVTWEAPNEDHPGQWKRTAQLKVRPDRGVFVPQVQRLLWGAWRDRVTRLALRVPREHLVAVDFDAVLTTCPMDYRADYVALKGHLARPFTMPQTRADLHPLTRNAVAELASRKQYTSAA